MSSLVVFHRHGHRAPARNVFKSVEESALWERLVAPASKLDALHALLPVQNHASNPKPHDLQTAPFGLLTGKGLMHLETTGAAFAARFTPDSQALTDPNAALLAYATNYQRTQASGQAFISGLLSSSVKHAARVRAHAGHGSSSGSGSGSASGSSSSSGLASRWSAQQHVREMAKCSMQFYDGQPALSDRLIRQVQQSAAFRHAEAEPEVAAAAREIAAAIPGLVRESDQKLDWLGVFDFFVCRREHKLLQSVPAALLEHEAAVHRHMARRYQLYYTEPEFGARFALPLLRDLCSAAEAAAARPVGSAVFFSGHDVTLLGLLYALAAQQGAGEGAGAGAGVGFASAGRAGGEGPPLMDGFWPGYGSTLTFVVTPGGSGSGSGSGSSSAREVGLRVFLDQGREPLLDTTVAALRRGVMARMERSLGEA